MNQPMNQGTKNQPNESRNHLIGFCLTFLQSGFRSNKKELKIKIASLIFMLCRTMDKIIEYQSLQQLISSRNENWLKWIKSNYFKIT